MKPKILMLGSVLLLFLFISISCQKDDFEIADENIEVYNSPSIAIYKTRKNYLNHIAVEVDSLNQINPIPGFTKESSRISISANGKVTFSRRWLLECGYTVAKEIYIDQSFTDITIGEFVEYTSKYNSGAWTEEMILPRIIDRDPFISFYYLDGLYQPEKKFTLGELNEMLENGTIEEYFTKLK